MIAVFAGPSLPGPFRPTARGFAWYPPARAGDFLALLDDPPERVCLIDGLFERCAAVWHKEILLLMERGTMVFGASSMGALRAAELDRLGMIGCGQIYRAFRDGRLTGDDEVALIHGPAEADWKPFTWPMVEVRATLWLACRRRGLDPRLARRLRSRWHELHFSRRDWPTMFEAAGDLADGAMLERIRSCHVPLKREDAIECLHAATRAAPARVKGPSVPRTWFMERLAKTRRSLTAPPPGTSDRPDRTRDDDG